MEEIEKYVDLSQKLTSKKLWVKFSQKLKVKLPKKEPIHKFEMIKKGKISRNRRYFYLYDDKLICFKVMLMFL